MPFARKRVLIFSTAYLPFIGGAEVAVKEIADRIFDYEFIMLTAKLRKDLPEQEKIGNIEVHRIGKGNHWDKYRLVWQGARYAQKLGHFDAIWGIMASYAGFAALRFKKRNKTVPFLLTLQEGDSKWDIYKHVWWCWPYFKQIFKRADKIQAISNYLAGWAKNLGAKCQIDVVPNGIATKYEIRNKKYENNAAKTVITVSRLVKKNGIGDLIKAVKILEEKYRINAVLKILGEGKLHRKLEKLVKDLKIEDRVAFLGEVSNKEVYDRLAQADVFCRPSLSEGLGNAFLEAMSVNVPVIATPVGGILDFLEDGKTGWFCEVKDQKSIAEKIKYILDEKNKGEVFKVVENAKKLVEEKYSWDLIAKQMKNIFESL
ncbi:MAG: glycosyltransferase family 4 protein [Patescibacteria group bacterium]